MPLRRISAGFCWAAERRTKAPLKWGALQAKRICGTSAKSGVFPLAKPVRFCYNVSEKQKCGSLRVLAHPQSLHRWIHHLHNGLRPHRVDIIQQVSLFVKGLLAVCICVVVLPGTPIFSCVGFAPARRFCFSQPPESRKRSGVLRKKRIEFVDICNLLGGIIFARRTYDKRGKNWFGRTFD